MTNREFRVKAISVVGLGKLGAPLVACSASKGFSVIGVDANPEVVRLMEAGVASVLEPGLDELLRAGYRRISATQDYHQAVRDSDLTFIVVPTPSEPNGQFTTKYVLAATEAIGDALRDKSDYHLIVLVSTVLPGATDTEIKPVLERRSGKRCGLDFGLCYGPEFIALGSVIHDMLNPDFILIGESDPYAGTALASFYGTFCDNNPPVSRMKIVNAEITKISINSYITMKISFANNLSEICERLPGADIDVVTSAIGMDTRIGQKYIKGGLGYGGPCFPRDNIAFAYMARQAGAKPTMAEATDSVNRRQVARLVRIVTSYLSRASRVGILGLSYKPNTGVVEGSQSLQLAQMLTEQGVPTVVYDPVAMDRAKSLLCNRAIYATSMEDCIRKSDVVVLATPWPQFRTIHAGLFTQNAHRPVLIDCWRLLKSEALGESVEHVTIGSRYNHPETPHRYLSVGAR